MRRKLTYTIVLLVFVAMWGFVAAVPASAQPPAQTTVVVPTVVVSPIINTVIVPGPTQFVPVTGDNPNSTLMLLFYAFLAILGIVLLIALFALANRSTTTTTYVRRDGPPPPPSDDDLP